jgi:hypothetical protein
MQYGHFELIVSGSNEQGIRVSSTPGFIPVCIGTTQSQLDVTFNVIDTAVSETTTEDQIEFRLKAKPGTSKTVYRRLSLQKLDGTRVLNIHGKAVYLDSLAIPQEGSTFNTVFTDTFSVTHNVSTPILPFLFKTSTTTDTNTFSYSTHMIKLAAPTSTRGRVLTATINNTIVRPELAAIYNLTGKKIAVISYVNYLNGCLPSEISRGMYIVKFLQANRMEIKRAGVTKIIVR